MKQPHSPHCPIRGSQCPSRHKVHVLPCVFLSLSTRKPASSWIRASILFFPIPKSRRVVRANRRSCLQVSPLLVTMPDRKEKQRKQMFSPLNRCYVVNSQHANMPLCRVLPQLLYVYAPKSNFSSVLEMTNLINVITAL